MHIISPFNRAHRIFVCFMLQNNYRTLFQRPFCWRPEAYAPFPLPAAIENCYDEHARDLDI